jgi:hypothetical protein
MAHQFEALDDEFRGELRSLRSEVTRMHVVEAPSTPSG